MKTYPAKYIDQLGEIITEIKNDDECLSIELAGIKFVSRFWDDFTPLGEYSPEQLQRFKIDKFNELTEYQLIVEIPIAIILANQSEENALLIVDSTLGKRLENTHLDKYALKFTFSYQNESIIIENEGYFESGLLAIQEKFHQVFQYKNCFGCLFSDYSYYGQGVFGTMVCFKNIPEAYLKVKSKDDYMAIFEQNAGMVQEIFCCEKYTPRIKGTGYRG